MGRVLIHPLSPLAIFSVGLTALSSLYLAFGLTPSAIFQVMVGFSWCVLLVLWIVADARRRKLDPCFDFGLFCYLFLPVSVLWYCIWSRGWRGTLVLAAIAGIWVGPYFVARLVWLALYR